MRTITINVGAKTDRFILGRRGENEATLIVFDVSQLIATYGEGTAVLLAKRPTDGSAYPVTVTQDGNTVTWTVTDTDTSYKGQGECELFWYVNNALAKSVVYATVIGRDIGTTTDEVPDPYEAWLDTLTEAGAEVTAAINTFTGLSAEATTLAAGSSATAQYEDGVLTLGIPKGDKGDTGEAGATGATGAQGDPGVGVPTGGTTGQVLAKTSNTDYDTEWVNPSGGGGAVSSVNGQTGAVVLDASDVGALADTTTASDLGAYVKPSGGIPKTDLASAVQTSLGKADTALQTAPVTSVNGATGAVTVAVPTKTSDLTNDSGFITSAPVSSVNGQTGAVALSIPSTAADVGAAPAVTEVIVSTAGDVTASLDAGKIYHFTGAVSSLTLTLNAAASGVIPQYHFDFDSGSTAATVSITGVTWPDGSFTPEASKHYEVDILGGYAVVMAW